MASPRIIGIVFGGAWIIRTLEARYVWEHPYFPQYYVPREPLFSTIKRAGGTLTKVADVADSNGQIVATQYQLSVGDQTTDQVIVFAEKLEGKAGELGGLVKLDFAAMDHWFEEDTKILVHPKDPFKRIEMLGSRRPVIVKVGGREIARSDWAVQLYEGELPCRYYLPMTAYDMSVLRRSSTRTRCPYKGEAEYYSVQIGDRLYEDLLWFYSYPSYEAIQVAGLVCPYNEKVDLVVEGRALDQPDTHFGRSKVGSMPEV